MQGPQSSPGADASKPSFGADGSKPSPGPQTKQDQRQQPPFKPSHDQQADSKGAAEGDKLKGTSFTASTTLSLDTALGLYKMTQSQSFWETKQDTRCLVGWGNNTVVVAFRGTASMKNALADLQVTFRPPLYSLLPVCVCACMHASECRWQYQQERESQSLILQLLSGLPRGRMM